jgi:YspA, cpYpsA-related SLOG family
MKVLVTGDRNWVDRDTIEKALSWCATIGYDTVIEGEARGADRISREIAESIGMKVESYPANWDKYHRSAGSIRNQQMLTEGKPDLVIWFHHNLMQSKGTLDMVVRADKAKIITISGLELARGQSK